MCSHGSELNVTDLTYLALTSPVDAMVSGRGVGVANVKRSESVSPLDYLANLSSNVKCYHPLIPSYCICILTEPAVARMPSEFVGQPSTFDRFAGKRRRAKPDSLFQGGGRENSRDGSRRMHAGAHLQGTA